MTHEPGRILSRAEVALLLGISESEVDRLVAEQLLRTVGTKEAGRFELAAVAEYIASSERITSNEARTNEASPGRRRRGPYKTPGVARTLKSRKQKKGRRKDGALTGRWIAVYVDLEGKTREAGVRRTQTLADESSRDAVDALNRCAGNVIAQTQTEERTMLQCIDHWPDADEKHPRTAKTDRERALRVCAYYPAIGEQAAAEHKRALKARKKIRESGAMTKLEPLPTISQRAASMIKPADLTRAKFELARKAMQKKGLHRKTIADSFAAMSRLLRALAVSDPSIVDHAHGVKVVGKPPTYKPKPKRKYRALDASEVRYFINEYVPPDERPKFWTPAVTGARFAEFLAINWRQRDAAAQTIRLHEVVDRNGHLEPGLKTTHDLEDVEERATTTLFPTVLAEMFQSKGIPLDGYLVRTAQGNFFSHRNFYRDLWGDKPGSDREGPMTRYERDGGKRFTPQDLRKCFSSWLADAAVPQWIIDTWMGHSDPTHESMLGTQRRGSVLTRHYLQEMGSWRPVALEVLTTAMTEGRLPRLRFVRE